MNINLFMGLNIKKSCPLPAQDAQTLKIAKNNEPAYDKFKEIMSDIKKQKLEEKNENIKTLAIDRGVTESKSLSIKRLKNIDEKLYEFLSFIILANSSGEQKIDNLTIRINDGQVIAAAGDKETVIDSSFFNSLAENITTSIDLLLKKISGSFANSGITETNEVSAGSAEANELGSSKTIKDVLIEAVFNALGKTSVNHKIQGGLLGSTNAVLLHEPAGAEQANAEIREIALTETPDPEVSLQAAQLEKGIKQPVQTSGQSVIDDASLVEAGKNSNVRKDGRIISLERALGRLFKQLDVPEGLIDSNIDSIIGSLKQDSEELELGKKNFLNLAKKITVELSQLSKKFTLNLEELIARLETVPSGKFELNSHLVKSLRNTEVIEFYSDKFLKPFVSQPVADPGISNSGAVSNNPVIEKTVVNLADVIMQISSRIITKDGPVLRQLEIMLKPESLGVIRIKVEAAGDGVNIKIQTQYSHTEEIISSNLDMLKNNLSEKGVLLKDLSVFIDLNTGTKEKSFEGFSGFGNEFNRGNSPKQHTETDAIIKNNTFKDLSETGKTGNTEIDALNDEYKDKYGVDIVA